MPASDTPFETPDTSPNAPASADGLESTTDNAGSTNGTGASGDTSADDSVPLHVVTKLREDRRSLSDQLEDAMRRERDWADRFARVSETRAAAPPPQPQKDPLEDVYDEDERRMILMEREVQASSRSSKEAMSEVRRIEMENHVRGAVNDANSKANAAGLPDLVDEEEVYARIIVNKDGRYGRDIGEIVKNVYNKEFKKIDSVRKSDAESARRSAEAASKASEPNGKLATPTPPKPVEWDSLDREDVWRTAEQSLVEALQREKQR